MALVAFDFDGTLSDSEMTVLLGERIDVADEMEAITERAMNDEIEYAESLRNRVNLLTGLAANEAGAALQSVELRPEAAALLENLRTAGVQTAILTGGFERGVRRALEDADTSVDVIVANRLEVADGELTGEVSGPLIEGTKDVVLTALAQELDISLADVVAVGDGANDLPMLQTAGLGVGFAPKPAIESACDVSVESMDELRAVLVDRGLLA